MESQDYPANPDYYSIQLTFHYRDGHAESFLATESVDLANTQQSVQDYIRYRLNQPWCTLQTPDETVFVNMANVLKVEVKPTIVEIQGEGIFPYAQKVTPLTRSSSRMA